ncbi:hypothetical protein NONI108955_20960 [Nocardia ninae]|uniref:Uncharacterized protein n=1 Tax=Nocardia ninae NBRC 108245 TaxID=1210091 RepID=A0A511M9T4_9NOCA|nr:hypothetical protein NN4_19430 [Nocardia ninae NBRC 108245]
MLNDCCGPLCRKIAAGADAPERGEALPTEQCGDAPMVGDLLILESDFRCVDREGPKRFHHFEVATAAAVSSVGQVESLRFLCAKAPHSRYSLHARFGVLHVISQARIDSGAVMNLADRRLFRGLTRQSLVRRPFGSWAEFWKEAAPFRLG